MKMKMKCFPFNLVAENKTSNAGNEYLSIGLAHAKKLQQPDDNGNNYESIWLNFIDKRDLLVLANFCNMAYARIIAAENKERANGQTQQAQTPAPAPQPTTAKPAVVTNDAPFDDDIPF